MFAGLGYESGVFSSSNYQIVLWKAGYFVCNPVKFSLLNQLTINSAFFMAAEIASQGVFLKGIFSVVFF